jgi:hypothetical protein
VSLEGLRPEPHFFPRNISSKCDIGSWKMGSGPWQT